MRDGKADMPKGLVMATIGLFVCMIFICLVAFSLPSGIREFVDLPYFMNVGFDKGLLTNGNIAEWLIMPGQYSMAFGFVLPAGKLLDTVSKARLLPKWTGLPNAQDEKKSVIAICLFGYLFCLFGYFVPQANLANIAIALGFFTYYSDLMAYYKLQTIFASVARDFKSPFGIIGAAFAAAYFSFGLVAVIAFTDELVTFAVVVAGFIILSVYYFCYAAKRQIFSEMEQKSLLILHVIMFNHRKRLHMRRGKFRSHAPIRFVENPVQYISSHISAFADYVHLKLSNLCHAIFLHGTKLQH